MADLNNEELTEEEKKQKKAMGYKALAGVLAQAIGNSSVGGISPAFWGLRGGGMTAAQQQYNQDMQRMQAEKQARMNLMAQYANMLSADKATEREQKLKEDARKEALWQESKQAQVGDFNNAYGNIEKLVREYGNLGGDTSNNAKRAELERAIENSIYDFNDNSKVIGDLYDGREMPSYLKERIEKYKGWVAPWKKTTDEAPTPTSPIEGGEEGNVVGVKATEEPKTTGNVVVDNLNNILGEDYDWKVPTNSKEASTWSGQVDTWIKHLDDNADYFGGKDSDNFKNAKNLLETKKKELEGLKKELGNKEFKAKQDAFKSKVVLNKKRYTQQECADLEAEASKLGLEINGKNGIITSISKKK